MLKTLLRIILLLVSAFSSATTYYVATTGSDSDSGSLASPWKTIQKAADTVVAGDTVLVEDGTYTSATCTAGENSGQGMVSVSHSGTASSYITFKSQNKWGAVMDGKIVSPTSGCADGWRVSGSYIRIQEFEMKGFADDAIDTYPGAAAGAHDTHILGNYIHHIGRYCTTTGNGRVGIFVAISGVVAEQNIVADVGRLAPGENGCSSPQWYQQNDHGFYVDGAFATVNGVMIRNNIFYRNEHGYSIQVYPGPISNLSILNNTFAWCDNYNYVGCIILAAPVTTFQIENNVVYDNLAIDFIRFYTTVSFSGGIVANNLSLEGISDVTPAGVTFTGNTANTDPKLVSTGNSTVDNATQLDAHLTSSSPAIDKGLTLSSVTNDYAGTARPQPSGSKYDLGAYEFLGTVTGPSAPTGLTATVQ